MKEYIDSEEWCMIFTLVILKEKAFMTFIIFHSFNMKDINLGEMSVIHSRVRIPLGLRESSQTLT
jgi:hypothetical protein